MKVGIGCHLEISEHYNSLPYAYFKLKKNWGHTYYRVKFEKHLNELMNKAMYDVMCHNFFGS